MKNIITLVLVLVVGGGLVYWLWNGDNEKEGLEVIHEIYIDQSVDLESQKIETRMTTLPRGSAKKQEDQDLDRNAVEFIVDDRGLVLHKLFGETVDLIVTDNESKDVTVYDGILTYSENTKLNEEAPDSWEFKALNLDAYIEAYLK